MSDEPDYTEDGVPSFDYVRDRIENRIATAAGAGELPTEAAETAALDEKLAERDKTAKDKLAEIRRSLHKDE